MPRAFYPLLAGLLAASSSTAWGCKCVTAAKEFQHAARHSGLIFSGKLVKIRYPLPTDKPTTVLAKNFAAAYPLVVYKFVPTTIWRGQPADTITLTSGHSNCATYLAAGQLYIVYTQPGEELTSCNRIIGRTITTETEQLNRFFRRRDKRP